jgi:hypothetical protein
MPNMVCQANWRTTWWYSALSQALVPHRRWSALPDSRRRSSRFMSWASGLCSTWKDLALDKHNSPRSLYLLPTCAGDVAAQPLPRAPPFSPVTPCYDPFYHVTVARLAVSVHRRWVRHDERHQSRTWLPVFPTTARLRPNPQPPLKPVINWAHCELHRVITHP